MKEKTIIGLAVAVLVLGVVTFLGGAKVGPQGPAGRDGQPTGSVTGPDRFFECETANGLRKCSFAKELTAASSTVCAIKSPASTSTLDWSGLSLRTPTSTAVTLRIATATTPFATTTVQYTVSLASGVLGGVAFTPTSTSAQIFSPNTYIVWDAQGFVGADTTKFRGTCGAQFTGI